MEEQLVSFETAKLAKEKGLPQKHISNHYGQDGNLDSSDLTWMNGLSLGAAPTQSLLQFWLLQTHSINIELTFDDGQWFIYVGEFSFPDSSVEFVGSIVCDNFNEAKVKKLEALERGLQEALKLIA